MYEVGAIDEAARLYALIGAHATIDHYNMMLFIYFTRSNTEGMEGVLDDMHTRGVVADAYTLRMLVNKFTLGKTSATATTAAELRARFTALPLTAGDAAAATTIAANEGTVDPQHMSMTTRFLCLLDVHAATDGTAAAVVTKDVTTDVDELTSILPDATPFMHACEWDVLLLRLLLNFYSRNGDLSLAMQCLADMRAAGYPLRLDTLQSLLITCGAVGDVPHAIAVYNSMRCVRNKQVHLSSATINALLESFTHGSVDDLDVPLLCKTLRDIGNDLPSDHWRAAAHVNREALALANGKVRAKTIGLLQKTKQEHVARASPSEESTESVAHLQANAAFDDGMNTDIDHHYADVDVSAERRVSVPLAMLRSILVKLDTHAKAGEGSTDKLVRATVRRYDTSIINVYDTLREARLDVYINRALYKPVLNACLRLNNIAKLCTVFRRIELSPVDTSKNMCGIFSRMIIQLAETPNGEANGYARRMYGVWDVMKRSPEMRPNVHLLQAMLSSLCIANEWRLVLRLQLDLKSLPSVHPTRPMFEQMLNACAHTGSIAHMRVLLADMSNAGVPLSPAAAVSTILTYVRIGDPEGMLASLDAFANDRVVSHNSIPIASFNFLVNTISREMSLETLVCFIDYAGELRVHARFNGYTYGAIITACARADAFTELAEWRTKAVTLGFPHSVHVFTAIAAAYARAQLHDKLDELIVEMRECEQPPNVITYTSILQQFVTLGDIAKVTEWTTRMEADGIAANAHTISVLLNLHARSGDIDSLFCLFRKIRDDAVRGDLLNRVTYTIITIATIRHGDVALFREVLDSMCDDKAIFEPSLLASYVRRHATGNHEELIQEVIDAAGVPRDAQWPLLRYAIAVSPEGEVDHGIVEYETPNLDDDVELDSHSI
jgi:pentatricopeptide repeat protein